MDGQQTATDVIKRKIGTFVEQKDFRAAVVQCEELEILAAATPFGKQDEEWSKVHLALLLVLDDVNNARHLWRRLPVTVKAEGGELAPLWGVGKCLWKREIEAAQAALRAREWSAPVSKYIALLQGRLWDRQVNIIADAFTSLTLERVASMLSCGVDDAEKECAKQGWTVEMEGGVKTVKPKPRAPTQTTPTTTPDYLQKMARHITFLERQNQG